MMVKQEVIQAVRVLREKWFGVDYETRLRAQPFLEGRLSALLKPFPLRADWADEMLSRVKKEKKAVR